MLTVPITTPAFHTRVLSLVTGHYEELQKGSKSSDSPAPIIAPLTPVDSPLKPDETASQIIAHSSTWIDLCSSDPVIAGISRQVLNIEVAYASFCGVTNILVPGPRGFQNGTLAGDGLVQYARAIQEALNIGSYVSFAIHMPMYGQDSGEAAAGDLLPLARAKAQREQPVEDTELYGSWDAWNLIRDVCTYNSRLFVGKIINLVYLKFSHVSCPLQTV